MLDILRTAHGSISRSDHHTASQTTPRCVVDHRLGTAPVGEPSIVIAVSSPHRKEAFVACELEELKLKAQIWKREYYEGESEDAVHIRPKDMQTATWY
jgi:molybdopterin synthase catalytic subunit